MVKVKICGVTNEADARMALESGADLLGFIFIEGTPRAVEKETVREIVSALGAAEGITGLFRDESVDVVAETVRYCGMDYVQLHGKESPEYCRALKEYVPVKVIKAFKVADSVLPHDSYSFKDYESVEYFVFDTFHPDISGGTGSRFDWKVIKDIREDIPRPFFVAGGLDPYNVGDAVKEVRPYGVDVSSGVEAVPGKKDSKLLKEFIENAKKS